MPLYARHTAQSDNRPFIHGLLLCFVLALAACGGGSDSSDDTGHSDSSSNQTPVATDETRTVEGAAVKGPMQGSSVNFYQFDQSGDFSSLTPIASTVTDASGNFNIVLPTGTPNVLIGISGGGFYDESDPAGQRFINWPDTEELLGFQPAGQMTAAITPMADSLVRKSRRDASSGLGFNHSVRVNREQAVMAFGFDPVSTIPPDPVNPPAGATTQEQLSALMLGGIAHSVNTAALHVGLPEPNFEVLHALLVDLEDCVLDGAFFGDPLFANGQRLPANNLDHEIERFRNNNFDKYSNVTLFPIKRDICANKLPVALPDAATTDEDVDINIPVLDNDSDSDGNLDPGSIEIINPPAHGNALPNVSIIGQIEYVPDLNFFGTDSFSYRVRDNLGARTNTVTVSLTINDVNDAPVANNDARTILEDSGPTSINVLGNDSDVDGTIDPASLQIEDSPANGTASINASNRIVYTPNANFNGTDTLTYRVRDDDGTFSNIGIVTINVVSVNDPPVISSISDQTIPEDSSTGPLSFVIDDVEEGVGSLSVTATSSNTDLVPNSNIVLGGSGNNRTITVTPVADGNGDTSIAVTVTNASGESASTGFLVAVTSVNDVPAISSISDQFINQDSVTGALPFTVGDVEVDPSDLVVTATSSNTSLVPDSSIGLGGSGENRTVAVTPAAGQFGSTTITLSVNDGVDSASTSFVVDVNGTPVAGDDFYGARDTVSVEIFALDNDGDVDGDGLDPTTLTIVAPPEFGTVSVDSATGVITYDPAEITPCGEFECGDLPNEDYVATFTYTVTDNRGGVSNTATVSVSVVDEDAAEDLAVCHPVTTVCDVTGIDEPDCGDPFVKPCATIQYAINLAVPGSEIHVAADTFRHDYMSTGNPMVRMREFVDLSGGFEVGSFDGGSGFVQGSTPTTLMDISTSGGTEASPTRVVECGEGVSKFTRMMDFSIHGSNNGSDHSSAVVTHGDCAAIFGSTEFVGRFESHIDGGEGTFTSAGILTQDSSSPLFVFTTVKGGSSSHPAGVKILDGSSAFVLLNKIDGGISSGGSQATGVYLDTSGLAEVWNNWIYGGSGATTTIGLEQDGLSGNFIANNTIYGGDGVSAAYPIGLIGGSEPKIYNNILFNSAADSGHDCIVDFGGGNAPDVLNNDLFDCFSSLPGTAGNVSLDPDFFDRSGTSVSDIDWHLTESTPGPSPCNVVEGGMDLSGDDPAINVFGESESLDIDVDIRTAVINCGPGNDNADGWSMGADELNLVIPD